MSLVEPVTLTDHSIDLAELDLTHSSSSLFSQVRSDTRRITFPSQLLQSPKKRLTAPSLKVTALQSDGITKNSAAIQDQVVVILDASIKYVEPSLNSPDNYQNYVAASLEAISRIPTGFVTAYPRFDFLPSTRKLLVLDLDETLVHSDLKNKFENHDEVLTFEFEDETEEIPLFVRPFAREFLAAMSEAFDVVVFTASEKVYADCILNFLDPDGTLIKHRLYRESCVKVNNFSVKDLRGFKWNLKDIVIVDNNMFSFANQLDNGVLVSSFYNNKKDDELENLKFFLEKKIAKSEIVTDILQEIFSFNEIKKSFQNNSLF